VPLERVSQGFKDLSMTFQRNPLSDDLIALKNETAIARSIRNIVFTVPGERFFDNDFGSNVSRVFI
jgi:phage baseplate assembly protein W